MNLDQWKEAARHNLQRLGQRVGQLAPGTVYGALCSASLLPVVTAAQQGDFAALVALGSVVGGVGGNLIANQIQEWRGRSEEDLAAELGQRAVADPQWLETLDALLVQMEAPQVVQASLNEQDWSRLAEVLKTELASLGSRVSVEVKGSGSAAVNHSAAAGAFGIAINGNVANSLVQVYVQRAPLPKPVDYRAALERYLSHLLETRHVLNLRGIPSFRPIGVELEKAYVTLRALDPARTEQLIGRYFGRRRSEAVQQMLAEQREEPVPLQKLLARHARLVVLGDPGSGKNDLSGLPHPVCRARHRQRRHGFVGRALGNERRRTFAGGAAPARVRPLPAQPAGQTAHRAAAAVVAGLPQRVLSWLEPEPAGRFLHPSSGCWPLSGNVGWAG
ncbi:MAG: hypothetical protein V9H69_03580 [Anaerolineae bacterium]